MSIAIDVTRGSNSDAGESFYAGARLISRSETSSVWAGAGFAGMAGAMPNGVTGAVGCSRALYTFSHGHLGFDGGIALERRFGEWFWAVPVAVTLWPSTLAPALQPFIGAQLLSVGVGPTDEAGLGTVAGFNLGLGAGWGVHFAVQWQRVGEERPLLLGAGVNGVL